MDDWDSKEAMGVRMAGKKHPCHEAGPSLHNAFAWALPFLFWKTGHRRAGNLSAIFASLVTLSTVYLAIHWHATMHIELEKEATIENE